MFQIFERDVLHRLGFVEIRQKLGIADRDETLTCRDGLAALYRVLPNASVCTSTDVNPRRVRLPCTRTDQGRTASRQAEDADNDDCNQKCRWQGESPRADLRRVDIAFTNQPALQQGIVIVDDIDPAARNGVT